MIFELAVVDPNTGICNADRPWDRDLCRGEAIHGHTARNETPKAEPSAWTVYIPIKDIRQVYDIWVLTCVPIRYIPTGYTGEWHAYRARTEGTTRT